MECAVCSRRLTPGAGTKRPPYRFELRDSSLEYAHKRRHRIGPFPAKTAVCWWHEIRETTSGGGGSPQPPPPLFAGRCGHVILRDSFGPVRCDQPAGHPGQHSNILRPV